MLLGRIRSLSRGVTVLCIKQDVALLDLVGLVQKRRDARLVRVRGHVAVRNLAVKFMISEHMETRLQRYKGESSSVSPAIGRARFVPRIAAPQAVPL